MASRATLTLVPRRSPATLIQARPFSSSLALRANSSNGSKDRPVRRNPLIGNYIPAKPAPASAEERDASVSTERPRATHTPNPDRSPVSSAEVAPNADMPPRPPPQSSQAPPSSAEDVSLKSPDANAFLRQPTKTSSANRTSNILSFLNEQMSVHNSPQSSVDPMSRPRVRTEAVTGRTIFIKGHVGPNSARAAPQAISMLNSLVKKQGIKQKFNYQRFHERRGMKKKRLKMVRWRRQFKNGFRETVKRVMELKKQGW